MINQRISQIRSGLSLLWQAAPIALKHPSAAYYTYAAARKLKVGDSPLTSALVALKQGSAIVNAGEGTTVTHPEGLEMLAQFAAANILISQHV